MSKFIQELRDEIILQCENLFQNRILPNPDEIASEELLNQYEEILSGLKAYENENGKCLELWRKRIQLWNQWREYEAKADDPGRFNNRGGTLLKEEKIRKG